MLGNPLLPERSAAELTRLHALFLGTAAPFSRPPSFTARSFGVVFIVLRLILQAAGRRGEASEYRVGKSQVYMYSSPELTIEVSASLELYHEGFGKAESEKPIAFGMER